MLIKVCLSGYFTKSRSSLRFFVVVACTFKQMLNFLIIPQIIFICFLFFSELDSDSSFGFGIWCAVSVAVFIIIIVIVKGMQYRRKKLQRQINLSEFDIIHSNSESFAY